MKYTRTSRNYGNDDILYMREAHFIMAVGPGNGKAISEITAEMGVTPGAVSQIASRLEKKGYILRRRSTENYRQIIVSLTPQGEQAYRKHDQYDLEHFATLDDDLCSQFSEAELRKFCEYEKAFYTYFTKFLEK